MNFICNEQDQCRYPNITQTYNMKTSYFFLSVIFISSLFAFTSGKKPSAKRALKVLDGFCQYVPSGKAVVEGDTVSVQSFYMSATEITNFQYLEFLYHLKRNKELDKLKLAQIDSAKWVNKLGYGEPYKQHYHKHPAYRDYPVVNVTKKGAELYCEWLTEVYDSLSNGEMKIKFRVPTHAEWMRAARGSNHQYVYTWGGLNLRNSEGLFLANCTRIGDQNITKNLETGQIEIVSRDKMMYDISAISENADVTAPAESYWPNDFGFYNMNGNVAEMISDSDHAVGGGWKSPGYDIRNESIEPFTEASSSVGFRVVATYLGEPK